MVVQKELNYNNMNIEEKINYWEKEKQETLDKLATTNDSFLIMQHKIQLDIIDNVLTKLSLERENIKDTLDTLYDPKNLDSIASNI